MLQQLNIQNPENNLGKGARDEDILSPLGLSLEADDESDSLLAKIPLTRFLLRGFQLDDHDSEAILGFEVRGRLASRRHLVPAVLVVEVHRRRTVELCRARRQHHRVDHRMSAHGGLMFVGPIDQDYLAVELANCDVLRVY